MSDAIDGYRDLQECRREWRNEKREAGAADIKTLSALGYDVRVISEFCFRIDGKLDLFPTRGRFHNIRSGKRGNYDSASDIAFLHLGPPRHSVEGT